MKTLSALLTAAVLATTASTHAQTAQAPAQAKDHPIPRIVEKDGRYALFVDGAPYLMLSAQVHNSSSWPAELPKVWPAMEYLNVNTVEMPVYWEQIEPQQGHFDFSMVDNLLKEARAPGHTVVRNVEERQPALHAGVDEAASGCLRPRDQ